MPYVVYVNILASIVLTVAHLKFTITESDKNNAYKTRNPLQFKKINKTISKFLGMKHSIIYKPLLIELIISVVYLILGVVNICEYYNNGCDNWIGYTSIHRFPILVVVDYAIFIPLVFFCRKKLKKRHETVRKTGDGSMS